MRYVLKSLFIVAAALTLPVPVTQAATEIFTASLSGANELPNPVPSPGTGFVTVTLDTTAQTLLINASFSGLTSPDAAAHIHCCAPLGTNAGVATMVPAFTNFPLGVTSGSYISPLFDLTSAAFYNPAFITAQGSLAIAEAAFINGLETGQTYFNIHTANFPGGEIRGQLSSVPLPGALPLFASGLAALALLGRRRKRRQIATT